MREEEEGRCGICLETGGREPAPCGWAGPYFHAECLQRYGDAGMTRCPHCNASAPELGLQRMRRMLDEWLRAPGLWRRAPFFIPLQRGGFLWTDEHETLGKAVRHAVESLLLCVQRGIVVDARRVASSPAAVARHTSQHISNHDGAPPDAYTQLDSKRCFIIFHAERQETTEVVLQRTAVCYSGSLGGCDDGYTLSAMRRRRRRRR